MLAILLLLGLSSRAAEIRPALTRCVDVLSLSKAEADEDRPVHVTGVLTCYNPGAQLCFVQDDSSGIYVFPARWPTELEAGAVVEVQGVTGSGRFSPIIHLATLRETGQKKTLAPRRVAIEELNTGRYDAQLIEIEGVVQNVSLANNTCMLRVWTGNSSASVLASGFQIFPTNLLDATLRLRGVGGTFYRESELSGFGLFLPNSENMEVVAPAPEPFSAPLRPARALAWFARDRSLDHRIRVQGVITVAWPGEALFIQDKTGAIRVVPAGPIANLAVGDSVEISGFPRDITGVPWVDAALVRKSSARLPFPEPAVVPMSDFLFRPPSGQFVNVEGLVRNVHVLEDGITLFDLQAGNSSVSALARNDSVPDLRTGSRVRVNAVWTSPPLKLSAQLGPVLWLATKSGVVLLAPPKSPAVAVTEAYGNALLASTLLALLLAIVVFIQARRKVSRLAVQTNSAVNKTAEMQRELERLNDDREGLGRDLHDRIIQSIYAIGLNLDDCARTAQADPPKVENRLKAALKDLNTVISELRSVILGLETNAIQPRELKTALKSLPLALGRDDANRIRLRIDEDALAVLTPAEATEFVHIAREGLSNSIRHGNAQTTTFALELRDGKVLFTIEDDGCGFNLRAAEGKGYGLRNMAKRAETLGASFSIRSEEGHGTRVLLDMPQRKQHFSSNESRTRHDR